MSYHGFAGYECDECQEPIEEAENVIFLKVNRKMWHLHHQGKGTDCFLEFLKKTKLPDRKKIILTQYFICGE